MTFENNVHKYHYNRPDIIVLASSVSYCHNVIQFVALQFESSPFIIYTLFLPQLLPINNTVVLKVTIDHGLCSMVRASWRLWAKG